MARRDITQAGRRGMGGFDSTYIDCADSARLTHVGQDVRKPRRNARGRSFGPFTLKNGHRRAGHEHIFALAAFDAKVAPRKANGNVILASAREMPRDRDSAGARSASQRGSGTTFPSSLNQM